MACDSEQERIGALRFATGFPPVKCPDGGVGTAFERASLIEVYKVTGGVGPNANEENILLMSRRFHERYGRYK